MFVEAIEQDGKLLCLIVQAPDDLGATTFVTPDELPLQLGFIVHSAGSEVVPHSHRPMERRTSGTSEVVIVRRGCCAVQIYDDDRSLVADRELREGDVVVLVAGGHGFKMSADTVLMEVKQGPYLPADDKVRFR